MENSQIYDILIKKIPKENILQNEPMSKHTSFKIGGNADFFVKAKTVEDVKFILEQCQLNDIKLTIVGNGSNLLVSDDGVRGVVLRVCIEDITIERTSEKAIVTVGGGVLLAKLAQDLLKEGISGFEFASGIPGTIGGAIKMNAGAYGSEFKDIVGETIAIEKANGKIVKFSNEEQKFTYRNSIFSNKKYVIIQSNLLLKNVESSDSIKEKMDEYKKSRIENQPVEYSSAGSTFKRGEDFITAKLIDECGLKGYTIGGAQVSTKHAGFIVNTGNATSKDVLELVEYVKKQVYEKFGKKIEMEIEVV